MPFHSARSIGLMPLFTARRYRLSPRLTTTLAPGLGVEVLGAPAVRTTLLLQAASRSRPSSASRAVAVVRDRVVIFPLVLRSGGTVAARPSSRKALEQFLRNQPATADQHAEINHGADVGQVTEQHRTAIALDEAGCVRQQRQRGNRVAERNEAERRHQ